MDELERKLREIDESGHGLEVTRPWMGDGRKWLVALEDDNGVLWHWHGETLAQAVDACLAKLAEA